MQVALAAFVKGARVPVRVHQIVYSGLLFVCHRLSPARGHLLSVPADDRDSLISDHFHICETLGVGKPATFATGLVVLAHFDQQSLLVLRVLLLLKGLLLLLDLLVQKSRWWELEVAGLTQYLECLENLYQA